MSLKNNPQSIPNLFKNIKIEKYPEWSESKKINITNKTLRDLFKQINNNNNINESHEKMNGKYLGKLDGKKGIIQLLKNKGINYFNIKNNIKYIDISGFDKKYSPNNIQKGSELVIEEKGGVFYIKIISPLLVKSKKFNKERIPGTNELAIDVIKKESLKEGIPYELYISLIGTESAFGTNLRSNTGYIGYSMLREDTSIAELLRLNLITKKQAKLAMLNNGKTKENIIAGIKYFGLLFKQFKGYKDNIKLTLAAYNGGPTKIKNIADKIGLPKNKITFKHIVNSGKLSKETKQYPGKILAIAKNFYNKNLV